MRIVIILCPCPTLRKVLGPEPLAARRGTSACSFDCDTNRCNLGIPGTQKPPAPINPWQPETPGTPQPLAPRNPLHPDTSGSTTPHLNFARNSPATLSNFESISLEFCGFLKVVNLSDHRITCEIDGKLQWPTPTLRHIARSALSHPRLTNSHEPTSIFLEFCGLLMSAADTADEL